MAGLASLLLFLYWGQTLLFVRLLGLHFVSFFFLRFHWIVAPGLAALWKRCNIIVDLLGERDVHYRFLFFHHFFFQCVG